MGKDVHVIFLFAQMWRMRVLFYLKIKEYCFKFRIFALTRGKTLHAWSVFESDS